MGPLVSYRWCYNGTERLKAKRRMHNFCRGNEDEDGRKSTEIVLFIMYGFLDAQEHGGEPLVQPGNSVIFLHLPARDTKYSKLQSRWGDSLCQTYPKVFGTVNFMKIDSPHQ